MKSNKEIGKVFSRLADLMEYHDENPFKIKSYSAAYLVLRKMEQPVAAMSEAELTAVKGIGASIARSIHEIVRTNTLQALEDLLAKTPSGVVDMLGISGFGVKKIKQLVEGLGVESLGELLYACEENRLVSLKGFGAKSQTDLQQKIQYLLQAKGKFLYANIFEKANDFLSFLEKNYLPIYSL
jgi:DNA polymerase (family 10)